MSEVLDEARRREPATLVLSSRCRERELLAYNAFEGIVEGLSGCLLEADAVTQERLLPPDAEMLSRMFPLLRRVPRFSPAEDGAVAATPLQQRARGLQSLRWLLSTIARERPVVVSIDDLQWADADSLALLAELFGTVGAPALALLVTTRPSAPGQADVLAQLDARIGACSRVELGRLPDEEARALVADALGASDDARTAAAIVREAAGHPLFLLALADQARTGAAIGTETKLDVALWSRVERVDARARAVLELLAVAGEPLAASTGTIAACLDVPAYQAASDTLRLARLARTTSGGAGVEPYHDRVREMLLARLDDARRRACHGRLAEALEASGRGESHPESLVRHLAAAGEPHRAARHAERAARRALEALAFDQAAHLYRVALELGPTDETWRHPVRVALADTLASAGRGSEAADVYLECAKSGSADARIDLQRKAADHLIRSGHVARGLDVLAGVLADHGEALPRSTAAALVSMLGPRLLPRVRKLRYVRRDVRELPATELRRFDVYHAVSVSL